MIKMGMKLLLQDGHENKNKIKIKFVASSQSFLELTLLHQVTIGRK